MSSLFVIVGLIIFGLLIAVHELGHFLAAKACNVRVEEFSIGMGPAIFKKQAGETLYALRIIPFGGFCAMAGEDEAMDDPRAFTSQQPWKRILILVAGSFMNVLMGYIIVLCLFSNAAGFNAPLLADFVEGCPYEAADALQQGDRFYSINGERIRLYSDVKEHLSAEGGVFDLVLIRDGKKVYLEDFEMRPYEIEGENRRAYGFYFGIDAPTVANKLKYSWYNTIDFAKLVLEGVKELVGGNVGVQDISGPVGIVDLMSDTGTQAESVWDGVLDILYLGAFIAVNLGIMNMLPIPALDGGRVFLLLVTWVIETITGKKLNPKYEGYIHAAGMVLLLALMGLVFFNDIIRIVKS